MTSLLKKTLVAGATALTIGAGLAAMPTSADAHGVRGFHGGGFHGGYGGRHFAYGYGGGHHGWGGYRGGWHRGYGWGGYGVGAGLVLGALASDYASYGNCSSNAYDYGPYGYGGYGPYGYGSPCFSGSPYGYGGYDGD